MITFKNIICSEGLSIDSKSNKVSFFEFVEDLNTPSLPLTFPKFKMVVFLTRESTDPEKTNLKLTLKNNDKEVLNGELGVDFQGGVHTRAVVSIDGLVVQEEGTVCIDITTEDGLASQYSFNVTKAN